jgi:CBS domain-containing protein
MTTVRDILQDKGQQVWTIGPEQSVFDALSLMAEKKIGALVVVDDQRIIGMLSERDYARKIVLKGKASRETPVKDIMTSKVCYVAPERTVDECMALMTDKTIRHLPVLENDKLTGLVSIGDVVKSMISEREFIIEQLESYITGK